MYPDLAVALLPFHCFMTLTNTIRNEKFTTGRHPLKVKQNEQKILLFFTKVDLNPKIGTCVTHV